MHVQGAGVVRLLNGLAIAANTVGALVVVALVAVLNYDVVARGVFSAPFHGAVEVVQFSVVLIVFLQLPDVVRVGRLTRSDGFLLVLGKNRPRLATLTRRIADSVSATLMLLIAIAIWPEFTEAWGRGDYFGIPGVFTAPWWPVKLTIFFSACLCTALFVAKTILGEPDRSADDVQEAPV
jgi:TRAP-type C4-dicarboxylate transport system permease small subunit